MSNGDDVLDNWEEIDEAGVSIQWHYNNNSNKNIDLCIYMCKCFAALHDVANETANRQWRYKQ